MPQDTVSATLTERWGLEVEEDRIDLLVLVKGLRSSSNARGKIL